MRPALLELHSEQDGLLLLLLLLANEEDLKEVATAPGADEEVEKALAALLLLLRRTARDVDDATLERAAVMLCDCLVCWRKPELRTASRAAHESGWQRSQSEQYGEGANEGSWGTQWKQRERRKDG